MAERGRGIRRWIVATFDRLAAKKVEGEFEESLAKAGEKSGKAFLREMRAAFDQRMAELKVQLAKGLIDQKEFKKQADLAARNFNQGIIKGMESARKAGTLTNSEYLKLTKTLKRVGDEADSVGAKLKRAFVGGAIGTAVTLGLRRLVGFLSESVQAAIEAQDSYTRLDAVLQPLGLRYQEVSGEVENYLDRLQKTTRFSDEDGREALVNLIAATGSYRKALSLLDTTAKIAEFRQTTMAAAAQTAADASKGLTKGMKDLGITTKDTGDIVAKINTRLGNLAEEGGAKGSGAIAKLNNLWGEFKEKIGAAIIGSDGFSDSLGPKGLLGALVALNDWAENNSAAIGGFVNALVDAAKILSRVSREILTYIPNPLMLKKAFDAITGRNKFKDVVSGGSTTAQGAGGGGGGGGGGTDDLADRQKKLAGELEKVLTDIAVARRQIDAGITESEAREQIRREQLLAGHVAKQVATVDQLTRAYADLAAAQGALAAKNLPDIAGIGTMAPGVLGTSEFQLPGVKAGPTEFPMFGEDAASQAKINAEQFSSPWLDAMDLIREEVVGAGTLFQELGQAWAEGGLAGIAQLAKAKVKENLARVIEETAKGFGSLFFNPAEATSHFTAAAKHGVAAVAWKAVGGVAGGGGGASAGGGAAGSAPVNLDRGAQMNKASAEVHIYYNGPKAFSPEMQKIVYGNMQDARERFGKDARVTIHRDG